VKRNEETKKRKDEESGNEHMSTVAVLDSEGSDSKRSPVLERCETDECRWSFLNFSDQESTASRYDGK